MLLADLSYLADEIGPVGPDPKLWAALAFLVCGALFLGAVAGWLAGRLNREERAATKAFVEDLKRRAAQLERLGPPGQHRVPEPSVLHEERTVPLGAYRIGGARRD